MSHISLPDIIEAAKRSVVRVTSSTGEGSGVVIDPRGIVATNRHVIGADEEIKITTADKTECTGRVIRSDANVDYALVKVDIKDVPAAPWNDDPIREGMTVVAIGHPLGYEFTVTKGIVSCAKRRIFGVDYIQTDCAINAGNSGGPLLDEEGEVIGITTWIRGDAQSIGFAIPINYVRAALKEVEDKLDKLDRAYYCRVCGFLNEEKGKYCNNCGALTDKPTPGVERKCPACQTVNVPQARFCKKCGASLEMKG